MKNIFFVLCIFALAVACSSVDEDGSDNGNIDGNGDDPTECPTGTESCECYGNDTCNAGLDCEGGVCIGPTHSPGSHGGACDENDLCDSGLDCIDGVCIDPTLPPPGQEEEEEESPEVVSINSNSRTSCALLSNGVVKCWGSNGGGSLGNGRSPEGSGSEDVDGSDIMRASSIPVQVVDITDAVAIGEGFAVLSTGEARFWGPLRGPWAEDDGHFSDVPVEVPELTDAVEISKAHFHDCALLSGGSVKCWGSQGGGRLGNGLTDSDGAVPPVSVVGINDAVAISTGMYHSCALLSGGSVRCWGFNDAWGTTNSEVASVFWTHRRECFYKLSEVFKCQGNIRKNSNEKQFASQS